MKLHGWCTQCRKVKRVTTSGRNLTTQPIIGLCDECGETTNDTSAPHARQETV